MRCYLRPHKNEIAKAENQEKDRVFVFHTGYLSGFKIHEKNTYIIKSDRMKSETFIVPGR